ncbi:hypothetical protein BaRGS_00036550 [Batillaria attramentaria]|uniref:phosphatidate phosphatase n=1 Tax=Batillaria attramentaria TaxID=370345 RepID=A0ABD0JC34_9CAEN
MSFSFVGRVYSSIKGFYNEINSATLTGAIDVVIVKQEDGSYLSSPFHVRFGKLGVLRSRQKVVDIEINGQPVDLHMKLGEAGEAFFVQEVEIPTYLATSPIQSNAELMKMGVQELKVQSQLQEQQLLRGQQAHGMEEVPVSAVTALPIKITSKDRKSDSSYEEDKQRGKPRRKVLKKKKQKHGSARPSPRSQSMPEGLVGAEEHIFEMEVSTESTEDEEVAGYNASASRSPSLDTALKRSGDTPIDIEELKGFDLSLHDRKSNSLEAFLTPFSDPEISPPQSPLPSRPPSPKSDTEVDRKHVQESQQSLLPDANATWDWGEFPKQTPVSSPDKEPSGRQNIESMLERQGKYGEQLHADDDIINRFVSIRDREDDSESGRGASLPQSPHSVDGAIGGHVSFLESEVRHLGVVSLSLCGGLSDPDGITLDKFMKKVITYDDLAEQPSIIQNPDLVVKIRDQYYNWATAGPMVLSEMAFHKQLPESAVASLAKEHMPKKALKKKTSGLSWFSWRRYNAAPADGATVDDVTIVSTVSQSTPALSVSPGAAVTSDNEGTSSKLVHTLEEEIVASSSQVTIVPATEETDEAPELPSQHPPHIALDLSKIGEKYYKTLRLTSEQISKLNLREGRNDITFSVTTQYQGTSRCMSHIYLWNYDDKIVISDIDGTITKSDVLGQILPIIGRDWSQSGVAQLFSRLSNNGYKLVYLSARAIGQSRITKDLLKSIRQGDRVLPDGPLLLNPTSLISAFHREVIVKNPEEFKISCLRDIADLFPSSPFYAGFGNKINDVIAYRALNIPGFRIFTINPQGQLRHDLSHTFISSYSKMSDIADHFFPPIDKANKSMSNEYSNVNYWRHPMPPIDQLDLERLSVDKEQPPKTKPVRTLVSVASAPTLSTLTTVAPTAAPTVTATSATSSPDVQNPRS